MRNHNTQCALTSRARCARCSSGLLGPRGPLSPCSHCASVPPGMNSLISQHLPWSCKQPKVWQQRQPQRVGGATNSSRTAEDANQWHQIGTNQKDAGNQRRSPLQDLPQLLLLLLPRYRHISGSARCASRHPTRKRLPAPSATEEQAAAACAVVYRLPCCCWHLLAGQRPGRAPRWGASALPGTPPPAGS